VHADLTTPFPKYQQIRRIYSNLVMLRIRTRKSSMSDEYEDWVHDDL